MFRYAADLISSTFMVKDKIYHIEKSPDVTLKKIACSLPIKPARELPYQLARLPFWKYREQVQDGLLDKKVLVVSGGTGIGKSILIGSMIIEKAPQAKILIVGQTQLCVEKLAQFMEKKLGCMVGYHHQNSKRVDVRYCKILVVTSGMARIYLQIEGNTFTHVVFDEAHLRDVTYNQCIRQAVIDKSIVLMSATFPHSFPKQCMEYFHGHVSAVNVLEKSPFEVQLKCIDGDYDCSDENKTLEPPDEIADLKIFYVEYSSRCITAIEDYFNNPANNGRMIAFVTGIQLIKQLQKDLFDFVVLQKGAEICILHSSSNNYVPHHGKVLILATSVLESGGTIPGIDYVLDFCRQKTSSEFSPFSINAMVDDWADAKNVGQRSGRTGRTCPGTYQALITKSNMHWLLSQKTDSVSMQDLLDALLKFKSEKEQIDQIESLFDKPSSITTNLAIECNLLMGFVRMSKGTHTLTKLGALVSSLADSSQLGYLVMCGFFFRCLKPILYLFGTLSVKTSNRTPLDNGRWKMLQCSEHFTMAAALEEFEFFRSKKAVYSPAEIRYFKDEFIPQECHNALKNIERTVKKLRESGFINAECDFRNESLPFNSNSTNKEFFVLAVVCALGKNFVVRKSGEQKIPRTDVAVNSESKSTCFSDSIGVYYEAKAFTDGKTIGPMTFVKNEVFNHFSNLFVSYEVEAGGIRVPLSNAKHVILDSADAENCVKLRRHFAACMKQCFGFERTELTQQFTFNMTEELRRYILELH